MEQINNNSVIQKIKEFNENIILWYCENDMGENVEVLTISKNEYYQKLYERLLNGELKPLENRDIQGIQKIYENGFDKENQCYYIVYENLTNYENLNNKNLSIQGLKCIAKGLEILKKENRQVFYITPETIFVNSNGNAKLKFLGLFELFKNQNVIKTDFVSPNTVEWLNDNKKSRPNFQDDMYSLIKSYENILSENYDITHEIISEILKRSLATNRTERFSKYHELIDLIEQISEIQFTNKIITNRPTFKITTKPIDQQSFQDCLKEINQNVWLLVENVLADKGNIKIKFSTQTWYGSFYLNERENHIFCPFFQNQKDERLIKDKNSFLANFNFDFNPNRSFNCVSFFIKKFEELNRLSELNKTKTNLVRQWQILPDKEREYVEETAFKARYLKREQSHNNTSNIKFELVNTFKNWDKVKQLKNENIILFIDDQRIGLILDFHPKENFITVKDAFCSIDEIPENGELLEDVRLETSQFKKQVEACKKFDKSDIVNPILCSILATPETTAIPTNTHIYDDEYENFKEKIFNKDLEGDDTQREAVLEALHYKPIYLIQGPPGTGKTTVIVELVQQILEKQNDAKILITSQSNLAVDNVLERIEKINQKEDKDIRFMRLASEQTLEKENITNEILPHTFENKLKNWVSKTIDNSNNYFTSRFSTQEKQKVLIDFYNFFSNLDKENGFANFINRLNKSHNYLKNLFEVANNLKDVKQIFEKNLSKDFLKLKDLQKDWFAFLSSATVDDGRDRKKSMLNNGSSEIDFLTAMLKSINIIGATCIHIASSKYNRINFRFDYVIMDESSKASPAETLVPINYGQNIILIGDHKQLPPVITREEAVKQKVKDELEDNGLDFDKDFGESLFERLIRAFEDDESKHQYIKMLDIQYRMPKQIGSLISKYFYDGKLKNPDVSIIPDYDLQKAHNLKLKKETSIVFISSSQKENPNDNDNKFNRQNKCNTQVIKEILSKLNELYSDNLNQKKPYTIGIIAGYRGQVELLKSSINISAYSNFIQIQKCPNQNDKKTNLIEINTVDKFQGAERDIIIYDIVRSSKGQSNIGFLDDYRRINVAFSRVKRLLIVVGDSEYLIKRATLNPNSKFKDFKLQEIAKELQQQGLVFNNINDIF